MSVFNRTDQAGERLFKQSHTNGNVKAAQRATQKKAAHAHAVKTKAARTAAERKNTDSAPVEANHLRNFLRAALEASMTEERPVNRNVAELWQHWNSYTLRAIRKLDRIDAPSIIEASTRPTEKEIEA